MKIDLLQYIPINVLVGRECKTVPLQTIDLDTHLLLRYTVDRDTDSHKAGCRDFSEIVPRYINKTKETFEVLGLLQAEMGKTQNGCITFCNHESQIIKRVIKWFERELEIVKDDWKWYIKVNIKKPTDTTYQNIVEKKVTKHWKQKIGISEVCSYPKKVSYISKTQNIKLKYSDYGSLIIDFKNNLFSQIVKRLVKDITNSILGFSREEVGGFMRGIIAGESCVEIRNEIMKFRVHISASIHEEKLIYQKCLESLKIGSIIYKHDKLIISGKHNLLELLKQKLMCISPKKYNKFLQIRDFYSNYSEIKVWKAKQKKGPHNKKPDWLINEILLLHLYHPKKPSQWIADQLQGLVSKIKVCRVLKEHDLGKQLVQTTKEQANRIIKVYNNNPELTQEEIANKVGLHEGRVQRVLYKFKHGLFSS